MEHCAFKIEIIPGKHSVVFSCSVKSDSKLLIQGWYKPLGEHWDGDASGSCCFSACSVPGGFFKKKPPDNIRALPNVIQSKQCLH